MLRIVAIALAATLGLACAGGDGTGDGGAGAGGSVPEPSIDGFIELGCRRARTCCTQEGLSAAPLDDCEAETADQFDFFRALERGTATLVEPAFSECFALFRANVEVCDLSLEATTDDCSLFFRGVVAPGAACLDATECASDGDPVACLRAGGTSDSAPGVCRAMARGGLGDTCLFSTDERSFRVTYDTLESDLSLVFCDASDGLYCAYPDGVCKAFLAANAPCAERDECEPGLYCQTTCQPEKQAGGACTSSDACALPTFCKDGTCTLITFADTGICEGDLD